MARVAGRNDSGVGRGRPGVGLRRRARASAVHFGVATTDQRTWASAGYAGGRPAMINIKYVDPPRIDQERT